MNFEAHQACLTIELDQALYGDTALMVQNLIASLEVAEGCYYLASIGQQLEVVLGVNRVA